MQVSVVGTTQDVAGLRGNDGMLQSLREGAEHLLWLGLLRKAALS